MGIFYKMRDPVFLKEGSNAESEINFLNNLLKKVPSSKIKNYFG